MTRKSQSIRSRVYPLIFAALLLLLWQGICLLNVVPPYMLPTPAGVARAFVSDFALLCSHSLTTLAEAFLGLVCSVVFGVVMAVTMDRFEGLYLSVYPLIVLTQTIPAIAIAPLLILWMGFGMAPKVLLIFITCFFPITVSTLGGLRSVDPDIINLMRSMGASPLQILLRVKLKASLESFFTGLKLAAAYAIIGAVISEWLGGMHGLGVYMTRVRKSYAFDEMFAVIIFISIVSLILMKVVDVIQKKSMPWKTLNLAGKEL